MDKDEERRIAKSRIALIKDIIYPFVGVAVYRGYFSGEGQDQRKLTLRAMSLIANVGVSVHPDNLDAFSWGLGAALDLARSKAGDPSLSMQAGSVFAKGLGRSFGQCGIRVLHDADPLIAFGLGVTVGLEALMVRDTRLFIEEAWGKIVGLPVPIRDVDIDRVAEILETANRRVIEITPGLGLSLVGSS